MQVSDTPTSCTAFVGKECLTSGTLQHVAAVVKDTLEESKFAELLIFNDTTGRPIDLDFRGNTDEVLERLQSQPEQVSGTKENEKSARSVGRPKLGVVSGEVTLLPRHWDWLKAQPGGASITLRKLVDEARRSGENESKVRAAQEAAYHFMTAMAGDLPQYEEALRALYAGHEDRFYEMIEKWTPDLRDYIKSLVTNAFMQEESSSQ
ncbi:DUF2239 family protein [Paenibacillus sp. AN1007]|jgi:hypothetical protein|uniref:DUF2239 family protein n=1 Tax=Paenibacillus sp. AN1007 TaxID=3151385 RepID=A0AAU8NKT7_9BACL